jgi:hypothetical protein
MDLFDTRCLFFWQPGMATITTVIVARPDSQKDDVRLDGFRQLFRSDRRSDRGRSGCKVFRVVRGCNGYFDGASGKRLSKSLAGIVEYR